MYRCNHTDWQSPLAERIFIGDGPLLLVQLLNCAPVIVEMTVLPGLDKYRALPFAGYYQHINDGSLFIGAEHRRRIINGIPSMFRYEKAIPSRLSSSICFAGNASLLHTLRSP